MARKPIIDESALTKGEIRKLNALRKSVGDKLGERTYAEWFATKAKTTSAGTVDKTAEAIADAIMALIDKGKIKGLPRDGYVVRRGRGRVVVEPAQN